MNNVFLFSTEIWAVQLKETALYEYNFIRKYKSIVLMLVFKVGGSVGLWLGLGVVQAAQLCATCLVPLLRRKTRKESIKVAS